MKTIEMLMIPRKEHLGSLHILSQVKITFIYCTWSCDIASRSHNSQILLIEKTMLFVAAGYFSSPELDVITIKLGWLA